MQAPFGRGEDPVSTAPSSAPAQQVFLGAAAQHTSTEQPRSDGISAPVPFGWNDWQPDAGDEATDWDNNTGAGPAEWDEGAGRCSEGREPPEGENLGDAATDMDAERQGMDEEGAAAAADDEPRLMQFNSTNKGILVDTCVHIYLMDLFMDEQSTNTCMVEVLFALRQMSLLLLSTMRLQ